MSAELFLSGKPFNKLQTFLVTKLVSLIVINKSDAKHKMVIKKIKKQVSKMSERNMIVNVFNVNITN